MAPVFPGARGTPRMKDIDLPVCTAYASNGDDPLPDATA
jgi:hypothetical protein